jgi:hypothetical protein
LREADCRRLLVGQQAEPNGKRQQLSREGSLVSFSHQPAKIAAEGTHVRGEFLGLGGSLVMTQVP